MRNIFAAAISSLILSVVAVYLLTYNQPPPNAAITGISGTIPTLSDAMRVFSVSVIFSSALIQIIALFVDRFSPDKEVRSVGSASKPTPFIIAFLITFFYVLLPVAVKFIISMDRNNQSFIDEIAGLSLIFTYVLINAVLFDRIRWIDNRSRFYWTIINIIVACLLPFISSFAIEKLGFCLNLTCSMKFM